MTPAARAALRNAADMLDDACHSASQDWLFSTPRGKKLRQARRIVAKLFEDEATDELDAEEDEEME